MNVMFRGLVSVVATVVLAGCGSGSSGNAYPDAQTFDGGIGETNPLPRDAGGDAVRPLPVTGEGNIMLFGGRAQILGKGPACTSEPGVTTDRWCAFTTSSSTSLGGVDLFVMNVSQAAAGTAIACGGAVIDPNCLKLTAGFFEEAMEPFPHAAGFRGDTLVYFDRTGTAYGWRPGLTNGKVLAEGAVHDCFASPQGGSILCLRDVSPQAVPGITQSELLVGRLDAPAEPPLAVVDTVISAEELAQAGQQRFRVGFRQDGEYVLWSSRAEMGGPEILKAQKVGDPTTRVTVATDVSRWNISPDGTRWYWLSAFNYGTGAPRSGTLQTASFPLGTAPTTLLPTVGEFTIAQTGAVVARSSMGTLQAIVDPAAAPATVVTLDTGVVGFVSVSSRGEVVYAKSYDPVFQVLDLHVKNVNGVDPGCALIRQPSAVQLALFPSTGGAAVWANISNLDSPSDEPIRLRASFTRFSDCSTTTLAPDITNVRMAGDDAVLIEDQGDGSEGRLRIQHIRAGNVLATTPPVLIQTRVDSYTPVPTTPGSVLFAVSSGSPTDGVYLHTVTPPPPPGPDAGSDAGSDAVTDAAGQSQDAAAESAPGADGADGSAGQDG